GQIGKITEDTVMLEQVNSAAENVKAEEESERLERERLRSLELMDPAADVNRARAEVATMRARLRQAEQTLEEHTLKAPGGGRGLRFFAPGGELPGAPPKKSATQFAPDRPRIVRAEVDRAFALRLKAGLPAVTEDDAQSGVLWRGQVSRV